MSKPSQTIEPLLIDTRHVAALLGLSLRQVKRLLSAGEMPAPIRLRSSVRFAADTIRQWIAAGCPSPRSAS